MAEDLMLEKVRLNYDPEGDVLYINFGAPEEADDADITEEGSIRSFTRRQDCRAEHSQCAETAAHGLRKSIQLRKAIYSSST
jgi:hypothetical protein